MKFLGFEICRLGGDEATSVWRWRAFRGGKSPVAIETKTNGALRKYVRAIVAAERTGAIRRREQ